MGNLRQQLDLKNYYHFRFSQAKKCSNEGRALMQLDYQQFRTKMEKIVSIKSLRITSYYTVCDFKYRYII